MFPPDDGRRFPLFNSPCQQSEPSYPVPMDIDDGYLASLVDELTIQSPRKVSEPQSTVDSPYVVPLTPVDDFRGVSVQTPVRERKRDWGLNALGRVDERTLRNLALLPDIVWGYLRLLIALSSIIAFGLGIYAFAVSLLSDVDKGSQLLSQEVMAQISVCSQEYRENRCDPATRVPALSAVCKTWEECMARDPRLVARSAGISAEVIGGAINSFFNVLTWKSIMALVFTIVGFAFSVGLFFFMSKKDHAQKFISPPSVKPKHLALVDRSVQRRKRF